MTDQRLWASTSTLAPLLCLAAGCTGDSSAAARPSTVRTTPEGDAFVDDSTARYEITALPEISEYNGRFSLLVFGTERVKPASWVVIDSDVVYCDIDGDGDLTEPGERREFGEGILSFHGPDREIHVGRRVIKGTYQGVTQGREYKMGTLDRWSAPIYHVAGPLRVLREDEYGGKESITFAVNLGTAYEGVLRTHLFIDSVDASVVPEMEFLDEEGEPFVVDLPKRC